MGSILTPIAAASMAATMSSQEIASLTGKEHKNVKRDIEKMLIELSEDTLKFERIYMDSMNRSQTEFVLDRELTDTLLTGYSAVARRRVVARWRELEGAAPVDPLASLPADQRALVGVMLENAAIKQVQAEQGAAIARIEQRVEEAAQAQLMLVRPANAESIVHIRERINKAYGLPAWIVDTVLRQSLYAPKPAGMVKNTREEARGASYTVYWTKDISALFARFVSECIQVTRTQATHPLIDRRFQLMTQEVGNV
jgi:phage regulator Rha-like protein